MKYCVTLHCLTERALPTSYKLLKGVVVKISVDTAKYHPGLFCLATPSGFNCIGPRKVD